MGVCSCICSILWASCPVCITKNTKIMAKVFKSVKSTEFNGLKSSQEFNVLQTTNQVGDKFYVPSQDLLLVLGTSVKVQDRSGNAIMDDNGEQVTRSVAQRFVVIKLDDDNNPVEARELYVGQIVKTDVNGAIAWPGVLSNALRRSSDAFCEAICGKCLSITDTKQIMGRTWDDDNKTWARDNDGNLTPSPATALKFVAGAHAMKPEQLKKAIKMLTDEYAENYSDYVVTE